MQHMGFEPKTTWSLSSYFNNYTTVNCAYRVFNCTYLMQHWFILITASQRRGGKKMFPRVSVSHSVHGGRGWVSLVPCPFQLVGVSGTRSLLEVSPEGWVCLGWACQGVGMSFLGGMSRGGVDTLSPWHGIQRDTVGKRAVRILLECFLVGNNISQSPSVLHFKNHKNPSWSNSLNEINWEISSV